MQLPDEAPKLPKLPFLLGDGALLAAAWFIARQSEAPLASGSLLAIVACVALGAILGAVPFVADYARKQEQTLLERQNALESLARTTAAAAEQIGIAANGLHTIAELAQKNLKTAEHLAPKLQEKINEFARRADEALVAENEALTQEVNTLRASEAEKLESVADKIRAAAAELAKLESTTRQHLAAVGDSLGRLPALAEQAAVKAAAAQTDAGRETVARVLAEIDARIAAVAGQLTARAESAAALLTASSLAPGGAAWEPLAGAPEVRRKRTKSARDEAPAETPDKPDAAPEEPLPAPVEPVAAAPAAPPSAPAADTLPPEAAPASAADAPAEEPAPARRKGRKPTTSAPPFIPGLLNTDAPLSGAGNEFSQVTPDEPAGGAERTVERAVSADGLTRLVATAYIGIGNRLFVRGEGPGLSWDKGVPLQFVSIGKWRWETADATAPVTVKLYKNDQTECTALGTLTLEPGQQAEVTAAF